MHRVFLRVAIVSCLFLAGCGASRARLDALKDAASGAVSDIQATVEEIDNKVKNVQSGASLIKKGINELGEAL